MPAPCQADLEIYSRPEVAAHYAALTYLTPCERLLFDLYIKPGAAILDVGVGGGRTTPYLSTQASYYAGVDYSKEMIRLCQSKFSALDFFVSDASNLSMFPEDSFDAVVIAFNGLDYPHPGEKRRQCLQECRRVLRAGGVLIFSSHNPRSIFVRHTWNRNRLRAFARGYIAESSVYFQPILFGLAMAKSVQARLRAAWTSITRVVSRFRRSTFWLGEGYMVDPAHGGLRTHYATPRRVIAELAQFDFQPAVLMGDDYPQASHALRTDWFYYVFSKASGHVGKESCA